MPLAMSKPSGAASAALVYITLGSITTVWSGIWFVYMRNNPPTHPWVNYLCMGFLATGLVLMMIGFTLGPLSRWARHAELPPQEAIDPANPTEPRTTVVPPQRSVAEIQGRQNRG